MQDTSDQTADAPTSEATAPADEKDRASPMTDGVSAVAEASAFEIAAPPDPVWHTQAAAQLAPPLPLPPTAFLRSVPVAEPPPPAPMPPRVFLRSGPAFEHPPVPPEEPALPSRIETAEPLSAVDAVLSEIDAEAASRSLTAIETPATQPPDRLAPPPPNLGSIVPRGAPTLEMPSGSHARMFDGLVPDRPFRPDLVTPTIPARTPQPAKPAPNARGGILRRAARILAWCIAGWLAIVLVLMVAYRFVNPPASMLMLQHWLFGRPVVNTWVPIEAMSPNIVRAVIASEDARFCEHNGVDFGALRDAVDNIGNGTTRGASTISMQVVKNLFLWPSRNYLRKAIEMPLTFVMELIWPKRRIMEVYLNIAEWGPGIFGIEAASRYRFNRSAKSLSAGQASRLAVALPNPLVRNPAKPGPGLQRMARAIQLRMRRTPASRTSCVLPTRPGRRN